MMRKVIAAINMTIDGFCDHTAGIANEQIHEHYSRLISDSGVILYGRVTYQLMEYWKTVLKEPTGNPAMDAFAVMIDKIPKIVFSKTLKSLGWNTARLASKNIFDEVTDLKQQKGKDILVGSPGLIVSLLDLHLIDELQICVHPVISGKGLPLFRNPDYNSHLTLLNTTTLEGGAVVLYYQPAPEKK